MDERATIRLPGPGYLTKTGPGFEVYSSRHFNALVRVGGLLLNLCGALAFLALAFAVIVWRATS